MMLETIMLAVISLWLGSAEYRMRKLREKLELSVNRQEALDLIDLKQEAIKISHVDIKKDIEKLEKKIDKLLELQLNRS